MVPDVNLKGIQRKVYMSFLEDGVWDIFLGLFVLGWGLTILTEGTFLPALSFVVLYSTVWGIKRWLTYPRIGYVRLSSATRRRIKSRAVFFLAAVLLLGALTGVLMGTGAGPRLLYELFPLLFNGMLAAIVCIAAYWVGAMRFYFYAAIIFLAAVIHVWVGVDWEWGFIGAGSIIAVAGVAIMAIFLRKYPKTAEQGDSSVR